ncbi:MAG: hypothetical protein KKF62_06230 [Bacteroidetes bacterium]|nr:hypothetical protein [Bacteroidota bacterium]MBU1117297.1 hypothetical protein [Bacteroidota bacterium]MBU1797363.1 hypothetical protein [Bacteroidota bacterium]
MSEIKEKREVSYTDYLSILLKWKKFLIINLLVVAIITTVITFLIPEKFKADSTIMIQEDDNMGLLNSVMSSAGSLLGGALFGSGGTSMDKIFGYLESRKILLNVINKFKLIDYYGYSDYKTEKTLKAFRDDVKFDLTQNGLIEISMVHESPDTAKEIVKYFILTLDSLNKQFTSAHAKSYRQFIERRYLKNLEDMKNAEIEFKNFQKKYKVYVIPEQLQVAFEVIAGLEGELAKKELEADLLKLSQGEKSPNVKVAFDQVKLLRTKINDITNGNSATNESIIYFPFKDIPELQVEYFRLYREIEIQNKLLEFTLPMYEQAVMEEQKDVPTIIVLDEPLTPELKDSPKKAFIILGIGFLFFFLHVFFVFRAELILLKRSDLNLIEGKEYNFYSKIKSRYSIK